MNKKFIMLAFLISVAGTVTFAASKVEFSLTPYAGVGGSSIKETISEDGEIVSYLKWNSYAYPVMGMQGNLSWLGLRIAADCSASVPIQCGRVEDYDYTLRKVSQYSEHDVFLDRLLNFTLWAGWTFNSPRYVPLFFEFDFGITLQMNKFAAYNGYLQRPAIGESWTGNEEKRAVQGNVISYEQAMFVPKLRFCITHYFGEKYSASVRGYFGGLFGAVDSLDSHYLMGKQFHDTLKFGVAWGVEAMVQIQKMSLSFGYDCLFTYPDSSVTTSGAIGEVSTGMKISDECLSSTTLSQWKVCVGWRF